MFYEWAINTPANTSASLPVVTLLELTEGIVTKVEVQFPNGCWGLAHCKILHEESQKWPTLPCVSFASDGHVISVEENYEISAEPYFFKAITWNLDDTYDHTIYVRIAVLRGMGAIAINKIFQGLQKMLALVGIR